MASAMYRISYTWHKAELLFDENVPLLYKKHHSSSPVHALCCGEAEEILDARAVNIPAITALLEKRTWWRHNTCRLHATMYLI
jgi:hypothetical protein